MASFPALLPNSRRYSFGDYPQTNEATTAGSVRFLHGDTSSRHTLQLSYRNLSQAEARQIRNHYRGQNAGHQLFSLSTAAWAGHSSMTDLVPSSTFWRYAAQPEEISKNGGLVDVTVQLVSAF